MAEFKTAAELVEWLKELGVNKTHAERAALLFDKGFIDPDSLYNVKAEQLIEQGISLPSATAIANKLNLAAQDADLKRKVDEMYAAKQQKSKKRDLGVTCWQSIEVSVAHVDDAKVWQACTAHTEKKCRSLNTLKVRPLITALRWQILKMRAEAVSLTEILQMKATQAAKRAKDLEISYYACFLQILNAAAAGIEEITFVEQNRALPTREDYILKFRNTAAEPSESKRAIATGATSDQAIDRNAEVLGKLVKCIRDHYQRDDLHYLCTMSERIGHVFLVEIEMTNRAMVSTCFVTPALPTDTNEGSAPDAVLIDRLDDRLGKLAENQPHVLAEILPLDAPPGFGVLSGYCDLVAARRGVVVSPTLILQAAGEEPFSVDAEIIASTRRSLVLRIGGHQSVIKLLPKNLAETEIRVHRSVDGERCPNLRMMLNVYQPVGFEEFSAIELEGFGEPLWDLFENKATDWPSWNLYFEQVHQGLTVLHQIEIVHRDVKPSNVVVIDGRAILNDYDCSARIRPDLAFAGTPAVQIQRHFYSRVDDLCSLCLCFATLVLPEWINTDEAKLDTLRSMSTKKGPFTMASDLVARVAGKILSCFGGELEY